MTEEELKAVWKDFWEEHKSVDIFSRFYDGANKLYQMLLKRVGGSDTGGPNPLKGPRKAA